MTTYLSVTTNDSATTNDSVTTNDSATTNDSVRPAPSWPPVAPASASAELARWLDVQERDLTHPDAVEHELRRAGWYPAHAASEAARYRTRFNEHRLGYPALFVATGVAALAAGTVGHALAAGLDSNIDRNSLALWLTALLVSLPFAIWAHVWVAKVDRNDPVAAWSRPRRALALALVWACGIVGIARLMFYGAELVGALVGATWAAGDSVLAGLVNVAITVTVALPLGLWAFHFLHRFDGSDPTQRRRPTRSTHSPRKLVG